ncbi:MAG TPA: hypothetical protein VMG55_11030 [Stellaceae bacterium]|nr:hypothetical protein [Stellaceae bacterium]
MAVATCLGGCGAAGAGVGGALDCCGAAAGAGGALGWGGAAGALDCCGAGAGAGGALGCWGAEAASAVAACTLDFLDGVFVAVVFPLGLAAFCAVDFFCGGCCSRGACIRTELERGADPRGGLRIASEGVGDGPRESRTLSST